MHFWEQTNFPLGVYLQVISGLEGAGLESVTLVTVILGQGKVR